MTKQEEIRNAIIERTTLGKEDHGIFTAYLHLNYGGSGQGFGGYCFDTWEETKQKRIGTAYGMEFIQRILETLEVESWEKLKGTHCRVVSDWGKVHGIGHFLKDQWFYPKTDEILNSLVVIDGLLEK